MDAEEFRIVVQRAGLEPLLRTHEPDLKTAIAYAEGLRGALFGKNDIAQEPWQKAPPNPTR